MQEIIVTFCNLFRETLPAIVKVFTCSALEIPFPEFKVVSHQERHEFEFRNTLLLPEQ